MILKNKTTGLLLLIMNSEEFFKIPMKYFKQLVALSLDTHKISFTGKQEESVIVGSFENVLTDSELKEYAKQIESDTENWETINSI